MMRWTRIVSRDRGWEFPYITVWYHTLWYVLTVGGGHILSRRTLGAVAGAATVVSVAERAVHVQEYGSPLFMVSVP